MTTDDGDDLLPLYATPSGQAAIDRWHTEDPDSYAQWLDDQWARENRENPEAKP
jgi:hypothetical protein